MDHVSARCVVTGRTATSYSLHLVVLDTNIETTDRKLTDAIKYSMTFPTPIFSEHPHLLIGVLQRFLVLNFTQIGQVMLKARVKMYSRDCHTVEFRENRHGSTVSFFVKNSYTEGTAVAQWLRCCATYRKVAGSTPDGVSAIFH